MSDSDASAPAKRVYERPLSAREVADWLDKAVTPAEISSVGELVRWFTRRYPTARQRLAYARRAYARWMRARGSVRTAAK